MSFELVSVIMPCFNAADFLEEAIDSILEQTYRNYELIVIDDCSSDGSLEMLREIKRRNTHLEFKIIRLEHNGGPGEARNVGISHAKGSLIALMDADDVWSPNKLEFQVGEHSRGSFFISCSGYKMGDIVITRCATDYHSLLKNNVINTSSVMFDQRRVKLKFNSSLKCEDYATWLELSKRHEIFFLKEVLVERRVWGGISTNKLEMAKMRWLIYRSQERLSLVPSCYYFCHYMVSGVRKYFFARPSKGGNSKLD